jgi:hypothetical protein
MAAGAAQGTRRLWPVQRPLKRDAEGISIQQGGRVTLGGPRFLDLALSIEVAEVGFGFSAALILLPSIGASQHSEGLGGRTTAPPAHLQRVDHLDLHGDRLSATR